VPQFHRQAHLNADRSDNVPNKIQNIVHSQSTIIILMAFSSIQVNLHSLADSVDLRLYLFLKRPLGTTGKVILNAWWPFCCPTNNVKALKKTHSTDQNPLLPPVPKYFNVNDSYFIKGEMKLTKNKIVIQREITHTSEAAVMNAAHTKLKMTSQQGISATCGWYRLLR